MSWRGREGWLLTFHPILTKGHGKLQVCHSPPGIPEHPASSTLLRKWWATSWLFLQHSCSLFEGFSLSDFKCFYKVFNWANRIWYAESGKAITRHQDWLVPTELFSPREGTPEEERLQSKGQTLASVTQIPPEKDDLSRKEAHGKIQEAGIRVPQEDEEIFFNLEGAVMNYSWVIWYSRPPKTLLNLFGENVFSHL